MSRHRADGAIGHSRQRPHQGLLARLPEARYLADKSRRRVCGLLVLLLMVPLLHKMLFVSRELLPKISAADGPPRRDLVNT